MARTTAFQFSNTTPSSGKTFPLYQLGLLSNYAVATDTADTAVIKNKTAPVDAEEILSIKTRNIPSIQTGLNIQNPSKVTKGLFVQLSLQAAAVTTESDDPTYRVDHPCEATISFKIPRTGDIPEALVEQLIDRVHSAFYKNDGTCRIADLIRGAERPIAD